MPAASTIDLIVPASESVGLGKWWLILIGVALGVMLINVLDWQSLAGDFENRFQI